MTRTEKEKEDFLNALKKKHQDNLGFESLEKAAKKIGTTVKVVGYFERLFRGLPQKELFKVKKGGVSLIIDPDTLSLSVYNTNEGERIFVGLNLLRKPKFDTSLEYDLEAAMGYKYIPWSLSEELVIPDGSPGDKTFLKSEAKEISAILKEDGFEKCEEPYETVYGKPITPLDQEEYDFFFYNGDVVYHPGQYSVVCNGAEVEL